MKTIFIPIFQGQQSRNILQTEVFKEFKKDSNVKLVIFTKPTKVDFYKKEYSTNNVIIEGVHLPLNKKGEQLFQNICLISIDTETIKLRQLRTLYQGGSYLSYWIKRIITKFFGHLYFLQNALRYIDRKYFYQDTLEQFFIKYQPDLVFCTNVFGKFDLLFLKTAKKFKVKTVGLVNSWDNLSSRGLLRSFPDKLLVHNEEIKKDATNYNYFPEAKISITGMPHFDYYITEKRSSKNDFYKRIGVSVVKKILLFCPAGSRMNKTDWQVVHMLDEAIKFGKIDFPAHILIRRPPNADMIMGDLKENDNITFDDISIKFDTNDPNDWEWSGEDMTHLADSLFYSSMVINYASTMSIDAVAFDKPVINVAFDGWEQVSSAESFSWFYYKTTHYKNIIKLGGVKLVCNMEELIQMINDYYHHPEVDHIGRQEILTRQIWRLDGRSSERLSRIVLEQL